MTKLARAVVATAIISVALAACERRQSAASNAALADSETDPLAANEAPLAKRAADPGLQWSACPPVFPKGCEIAVLRGDPAKPNADIFFGVPAGYEIPPHSHSSAERMVLVNGQLEVKYQGAAPAMLTVGSYAYGPAGRPHRATCRSSEPCILFIAFEGPVDVEPFAGELD